VQLPLTLTPARRGRTAAPPKPAPTSALRPSAIGLPCARGDRPLSRIRDTPEAGAL